MTNNICEHRNINKLLRLGFRVVFVMEKHEREQEHAAHHGECAYVIWERARYKAFVLRVLQRTHRYLSGAVEMRETDALIVYLELVHPVYVRNLEPAFVTSVSYWFHRHTHERIDPHEFQLQIVRLVGHPLAARQSLHVDRVHHVVHDCVRGRRLRLANPIMVNRRHAYDTVLFKHPLRHGLGYYLITGFLVSLTTCEQLI